MSKGGHELIVELQVVIYFGFRIFGSQQCSVSISEILFQQWMVVSYLYGCFCFSLRHCLPRVSALFLFSFHLGFCSD